MKILFFIASLYSGGKERRLVELIKGLIKYPNIEIELVLTRKEIHYREILETGIKIHYIVRKNFKKDPRLFIKFYKICRNMKPDIVHVWGGMVAIYAIPTKLILKIPMINNQIADSPQRINKISALKNKLTFRFSNLIIANSISGLNAYNAPRDKSSVIYNGFSFDRVSMLSDKKSVKESYNISTKYTIGMVATFSASKDYSTYIHAAISVLKTQCDVTFLCIGAGDDLKYKKMVPKEFIKRILFLGRQSNIESIMNICDIGVLSTYTEGISNSIMEFMAIGKPVIATEGGGTSELILDGETGILIPQKSPNILSAKIISLLDDSRTRTMYSKQSVERIKIVFSIKRMIQSFLEKYDEIKEV